MAEQDRVPPSDLDAEGAVLCAILIDRDALDAVDGIVTADDFYSDANRLIFQAAVDLRASGQPCDVVTVASAIRNAGQLPRIGGAPYLAQLANATPSVAHVGAHAKIVADLARRRALIAVCRRYSVEGYEDIGGSVDDWAGKLEAEVFAIAHGQDEREPVEPVSALAPKTLEDIKERRVNGGVAPGLDTGWTDLTKKIGGWESSLVYVVAGRPGMGKSSFMLSACLNVAKRDELAAFFSAEMPKDQLTARALAAEANIEVSRVRSGKISDEEYASLAVAAERIRKASLWIDHKPGATIGAIRSSLRKVVARTKKKLKLVAVDYLQILKGDQRHGREQEVAGLMRGMLDIAAEFECPVIAGSQLNRSVENRAVKDKRPTLGDLRESGAIEQDAYGVLMMYRDEYYNEQSEDRGKLETIIAKNRNGGPGKVMLHFTADSTRISNLASEYDAWADNTQERYP